LGRKPVQPGRVTTAVSLGTVGLFVISMGAGMQSWPFGASGAAMLVIGVALLTTASMRGADKAFVAGTVTVVKVSEAPPSTDYGRCEMQVLVDAPGHPGQTVVIRDPRVPVIKWPDVGETLPALVSVADARRVKIQWERVGTYGQRYDNEAYDSAYVSNDYEVDPDYGVPLNTDELPHKTAELPLVEDDDKPDEKMEEKPGPPEPSPPEPSPSLPRRQPNPTPSGRREAPVAVLEGELVDAEVPMQRSALFDEHVDVLDFSAVPEPRVATPASSGPAFTEDSGAKVIITQPNARPASAGSIDGIGYTVMVTELDRSMRFYRDMLGFYEIDGSPDWVVLASGDTRIVLVAAHDQAPVNRRLVHLNLEVGDVDAIYKELKIRGVRFSFAPRVVNRGERLELVAAAFKDPDGHGIAITQWKARGL
jgi:catechol 2,3-dioxygenase-like lactoylglutathione lyase family enzyme